MAISRRQWMAAASTATIALGASSLAPGQEIPLPPADIKLGIASYSLRKFTRAQVISMMKLLRTPYLNVKDFHLALTSTPGEIDAARKEFSDAGIILVGCGNVAFDKDDEADIRSKFEYAKRAGFPLIVCAPTEVTLPKLEKFVKEYDIKIAVHNHGPEDKHFPTPGSVLNVVRTMDPRCGLCIDIGHTSRTGTDIVKAMAEAGPRLLDMHVKDLADPMVKTSQVAVGEGKLPFPQTFLELAKLRYGASVNLEYEIEETDPMPGMQKSLSYMRGVLAGLNAIHNQS